VENELINIRIFRNRNIDPKSLFLYDKKISKKTENDFEPKTSKEES